VLSIIEKKKEGDKFYTRHENWEKWWWSNNCECDNMAEKSAFSEKKSEDEKVPINQDGTAKAENKEIFSEQAQPYVK